MPNELDIDAHKLNRWRLFIVNFFSKIIPIKNIAFLKFFSKKAIKKIIYRLFLRFPHVLWLKLLLSEILVGLQVFSFLLTSSASF